jgi:DNA-directed RNA polymerase specialized sigma24 family protein
VDLANVRDRAYSGRAKQTRPLSALEERQLAELTAAVNAAHEALEARIEDLYFGGVSQQSIADCLGVTQKAVSIRLARRREWQRATREYDTDNEKQRERRLRSA